MNNNLLDKKASNECLCSIIEIIKNVGLTDLSKEFGLLKTTLNASDKGNYAIFLGAGASLGSGGKSGYQIALKFAKNLYGKDIDINKTKDAKLLKNWFKTTFGVELSYTSAMETIGTKPEMKDVMAKALKGMEPSIGYKSLAKLITENYFQIIFTTNFDWMIENALIEKGLKERVDFSVNIVGEKTVDAIIDSLQAPSPQIKIVKLHGDIGYASSMKCTSKETEKLPEKIENIFEVFLKKKGFIFVGYGGWDEGILKILDKHSKNKGPILHRKRAPAERSVWWVSPQGLNREHENINILLSFLRARGSKDNVIQDVEKGSQEIPFGDFDTFFVILCEELLGGCIRPIILSSKEILTEISNAIETKNYSYLSKYLDLLESKEGDSLLAEEEFRLHVFENFEGLLDKFRETDVKICFNLLSLLLNRWDYFYKYLDELPPHLAVRRTGKVLVVATYVLKNKGLQDDKEDFMSLLTLVSNLLRPCTKNMASLDRGARDEVRRALEYCDRKMKEALNLLKYRIECGIMNSKKYMDIVEYKNSEFRQILEIFLYVILMRIPQLVFYYEDKKKAFDGTVGIFLDLPDVLGLVREQYSTTNCLAEERSICLDVTSLIDSLQKNINELERWVSYRWGNDEHG